MKGKQNMENENYVTAHECLVKLAKKHAAQFNPWEAIYRDMRSSSSSIEGIDMPTAAELKGWKPITILDPEYPGNLRLNGVKPPFVLFAKGDMGNLVDGALLILSPYRYAYESKIEALFQQFRDAKIPVVIAWQNPDNSAAFNGFAQAALRAYQNSGVPFTVIFPASARNRDALADQVAASGGLALTEAYPGSPRRTDPVVGRIGPYISKAALVVGGEKSTSVAMHVAYALNAGLDVGAIPWPPLTPAGELCHSMIRDGAALVASVEDALDLLNALPKAKA